MKNAVVFLASCILGAASAVGCAKQGQTNPQPQWKTPPKEGYLRLEVYGESNLEHLAKSRIRDGDLPLVFADALKWQLTEHKKQLPEGLTDDDIKVLTDKAGEVFRSVQATSVEDQTVQKAHSVAVYRLYEVSREELKRAVEPAIRGVAKAKGWNEDKIIKVVNEAIDTMRGVG